MRLLVLLLATLAFLPSCRGKAEGQAQLPPAAGPGAPPLPALPSLDPPRPPAAGDKSITPTAGKTTGTLYPHAEAEIAPNASGVLAEVLVDEGSRVKKGDVLFRLDSRDASLRRDQAKAALDAARVQQRAAKQELDRSRPMVDQNAMNRAQWDQIQSRYDAAGAGVQQAEVALAMANKALGDTTVRAPLDGVVTAKNKSPGEMVTSTPPTIVVVVQQQELLDLRFRLPETALAKVKPGQTLTATFSALGVSREVKVSRLNPTVDIRSRTVEAVAEVPNPDLTLKPGLLAEIELRP